MEEEFLDLDEQFELMYADEIELMNEMDIDGPSNSSARRSLNFGNDGASKTAKNSAVSNLQQENQDGIESFQFLDSIPSGESDGFELFHSNTESPQPLRLLNETHENKNKRKRKSVESFIAVDEDYEIIEKIKHKRRQIRETTASFGIFGSYRKSEQRSKVVITNVRPQFDYVGITNKSGEKVFVKLNSDEVLQDQIQCAANQCKSISLLSVPFSNIQDEAHKILEARQNKIQENLTQSSNTEANSENYNNVAELWVEKYKPVTYLELLSDEGTNRVLLQWLKLWDKAVFGKEKKSKLKRGKENKFGNGKFMNKSEFQLNDELDENGCPKQRIILLCGPPGLGKTTLAHMVAKHAGYNAIEMNASDDRSPEIFRTQLESSTQMRSVLDNSKRPNCLVIDEIDGAPQASVEVLVNFVKGKVNTKGKSKKGVKLTGVLRRPIICICNDIYVPALRTLRQISFVLHFSPTTVSRLSQRLVEISKAENIDTDITAMMALCEKANSDIRSCLSTMYCLKNQPIRLGTIHKINVGNKDMHKGLFTVWQSIFQIYTDKEYNAGFSSPQKTHESLINKRIIFVLKNVQSNGDTDKLMQGVYENFLNVKKECSLYDIFQAMEWFCFFDEMKLVISRLQNYSLLPYLPYCFGVWHSLFSSYNRPKLHYPSLMYELSVKQTQSKHVVHDVLCGMPATIHAYCRFNNLSLDTLPLLLHIIKPNLRPVSLQLYSPTEMASLQSVVNSLIDYNINFVQMRLQDGNYEYVLEPNIETVVKFSNEATSKGLNYSVKQIISREVEAEKMKRLESVLFKDVKEIEPIPKIIEKPKENKNPPAVPNHLQRLTPKTSVGVGLKVKKDFFGRIVKNVPVKSTPANSLIKTNYWFRFNEGVDDAVRRIVYMKDLL